MLSTIGELGDKLKSVGYVEWVRFLQFALRYRFAYEASAVSAALRIFVRAIFESQRRRARDNGIHNAQCGGSKISSPLTRRPSIDAPHPLPSGEGSPFFPRFSLQSEKSRRGGDHFDLGCNGRSFINGDGVSLCLEGFQERLIQICARRNVFPGKNGVVARWDIREIEFSSLVARGGFV